jgi:uncharacterized membrane protein
MASFTSKLRQLAKIATERGVVDATTASALVTLAEQQEREGGVRSLSSILGALGGGTVALGVMLLVAANWQGIGDWTKIGGLLLLLGGAHGVGFWITATNRPYVRAAEALHFLGAGLVMAGIALVSQIFNLDAHPPNGVLIWLVAVVPLAYLLRSAAITGMAVFALVLWAHMEGSFSGSPIEMPTFAVHLMLEVGLGTALLGAASVVRDAEPEISHILRAAGGLLLIYGVYTLGFYRYFSDPTSDAGAGAWVLPSVALVLGGVGLWIARETLANEAPWLRDRLNSLLVILLSIAAMAVVLDLGVVPSGRELWFFDFGNDATFSIASLLVTFAAWALWFLLAFWCVAFGTRSGRKRYLDIGVAAVGLGVVTRFFDLIGGQTGTGILFVVGGLLLIGTAWGMEKWRRQMLARMGGT